MSEITEHTNADFWLQLLSNRFFSVDSRQNGMYQYACIKLILHTFISNDENPQSIKVLHCPEKCPSHWYKIFVLTGCDHRLAPQTTLLICTIGQDKLIYIRLQLICVGTVWLKLSCMGTGAAFARNTAILARQASAHTVETDLCTDLTAGGNTAAHLPSETHGQAANTERHVIGAWPDSQINGHLLGLCRLPYLSQRECRKIDSIKMRKYINILI